MTQFECFAGSPAAPATLIQLRLKASELSSQDFYQVTVYHVIRVVQAHKIGQLFIYDDKLKKTETVVALPGLSSTCTME